MATYYVDGAVGNDGNTGTSEGAGNAWATIQYAETQMNNGDHTHVKASATYNEQLDINDNGASASWIWLEGYTTTPGDHGKVTIDAQNTRAHGISYALADVYWRIENFIVVNATGNGMNFPATRTVSMTNCESNDNGGNGFELFYNSQLTSCYASGNTGNGFDSERSTILVNCTAIANGVIGFTTLMGGACINCLAVGNITTNFKVTWNNYYGSTALINCTSDGSGKTTANAYDVLGSPNSIINCIATDCDVGFYTTNWALNSRMHMNNAVYNCTTDYQASYNYSNPNKDYDVTTDPLYTDSANLDYSLKQGSPCRNAGLDISGHESEGMDIGAYQMRDKKKVIVG